MSHLVLPHRFPPAVIQHAVWLHLRFTLSYRMLRNCFRSVGSTSLLRERPCCVLKFGPMIARRLRLCSPRSRDRWHLDEMVVRIAGERMYLWRAVDHEGEILDVLLQRQRNRRAAVKLVRKLLRKQAFALKRLTTDQLRFYSATFGTSGLAVTMSRACDKQSRREFTPGGATARAEDATLQIAGLGSTVPEHACRCPQSLQRPPSSWFPVNRTFRSEAEAHWRNATGAE